MSQLNVATVNFSTDSTQKKSFGHAYIVDQKAADVGGGSFTSGAWRTKDLNTEIFDYGGIVSISSNQFTLANAGTYTIYWRSPALMVEYHISRLYDVTNTTGYNGSSEYSYQDGATTHSVGEERLTITGSTVFEIQHYCNSTISGDYGRGTKSGYSGSGGSGANVPNVYTIVEIWREA